jgi:hypothetical protein
MKMKKAFALFILSVCVISCGGKKNKQKQDPLSLPEIFNRIADKTLPTDTLIKLVKDLDTSYHEKTSFWLDMIRNKAYGEVNRSIYAVKLVERHVKPGMLLRDFPQIFLAGDTAYFKRFWIYAEDTLRSRKIIRGGSWKDIGYYLRPGNRYDTLLPKFKLDMMRKGFNLFYIEASYFSSTDSSGHGKAYETGIYIAVDGKLTRDEFQNYLAERKHLLVGPEGRTRLAEDLVIKGVFATIDHWEYVSEPGNL